MTFTARLGKTPNGTLGNIELGTTDTLSIPFVLVVPDTRYFTGFLGLSRSVPSHIVLGRGFMRMVASPTLNAALSFFGLLFQVLINRLLFPSATTIITQARRLTLKVVQRTTTQLDTLPATLDVARTELYPIGIDFTQYIASGDTLSTPTVALNLQSTGTAVPNTTWLIGNTMSISGNIVQVPMNTAVLQLNQKYILALTVKLNTNKILTSTTTINVVT